MIPRARVERRAPADAGRGLARLATGAYAALARAAGRRLAACEGVECVYVRRSVATGEVAFGRSDIDLGILIRDACAAPGAAGPVLALGRAVRGLRRVNPLVGEVEVVALAEHDDWARHQAFRESLNRAAFLAAGRPFEIPLHPIDRDEAAWRFAFWFERYLPRALRRGSRRDLGKFLLEMWTAAAVAQGRLAEPPLTRREMEAAWRRDGSGPEPPPAGAPVADLARAVFGLAARLHAALLPPLRPVAGVVEAVVSLPPKLVPRTLRVGSVEALSGGGRAWHGPADAMAVTPEALDLYVQFVNPFAYDRLPGGLRAAGLARPPVARALALLEKWTCGPAARQPGFGNRRFGLGPRSVAYARHAARALAGGRWPGPVAPAELGELGRDDLGIDAYYRDRYAAAYEACTETRAVVAEARMGEGHPARG